MAIRLYDSLTRELRELKPSQPDGVFRMYCCGPTVYAPAHIGNFRTFLIQDVLRRLLELEFGPGKVKHVRNLTDVDDRTIGQAKREKRPLAEITRHWTELFHDDCRALNLLPPHVEPTATGHIAEQVQMINELLAKGLAYVAPDGSVYYKIAAFPSYGALSRIKERELKVTVATADDDHKDDASDFALWKAYKPDEDGDVKWPGPRGAAEGRPGWHIECSAMSRKHLGETIDLHAGGVDLLFPHHENEIAQSEGCTGHLFSHHWYHNEFLLVDGKKMSKSLGNLYTLADLVSTHGSKPMAVRYALLSGHPRKQLNFSLESLRAAESALRGINHIILELAGMAFGIEEAKAGWPSLERFWSHLPNSSDSLSVYEPAWNAMQDDLNIPEALAAIFTRGRAYAPLSSHISPRSSLSTEEALQHLIGLRKILWVLGFTFARPEAPEAAAPDEIKALAEKRKVAKLAKDFATADALRKELAAAGWNLKDAKDGTYTLEPVKR
jgi:cysteinyl-tRNA synthetase